MLQRCNDRCQIDEEWSYLWRRLTRATKKKIKILLHFILALWQWSWRHYSSSRSHESFKILSKVWSNHATILLIFGIPSSPGVPCVSQNVIFLNGCMCLSNSCLPNGIRTEGKECFPLVPFTWAEYLKCYLGNGIPRWPSQGLLWTLFDFGELPARLLCEIENCSPGGKVVPY